MSKGIIYVMTTAVSGLIKISREEKDCQWIHRLLA